MEILTTNLEKKLLKENRRLTTPKELLLLRESEKFGNVDTMQVLSKVGLNSNIEEGIAIKNKNNKMFKDTKSFNKERVFHISQIESICKKYGLRFLPSDLFKGNLDEQLPFKITTFETAHNIHCCSNKQFSNCFIVAPAKSFRLQKNPKDPLFFYQINEEYFYLIHKWGNDLNVFRRLLGVLGNPILSFFIFTALAFFSIYFCAKSEHIFWQVVASISSIVFCVVWIGVFCIDVGAICNKKRENAVQIFDTSEWRSKFEN